MDHEFKDTLFINLINDAKNPRLKTSIERVKVACYFLESAKAKITPNSVGRYCEDRWDGPKSQSIRNARNTLLHYIETRKCQQKIPHSHRSTDAEPTISDETIKAYAVMLRAERDEAIQMKNRIISGLRKISGIPIDELIANGFKQSSNFKKISYESIPEIAIHAIRKILSQEYLSKVGLELDRNRIRHRVTGAIFLEKTDVESLRSLLKSEEDKTIAQKN